jgi:hypothetical protein
LAVALGLAPADAEGRLNPPSACAAPRAPNRRRRIG